MLMPYHKIENFSSSHLMAVKDIPTIKARDYFIDDTISVDGDAPKKFIGVYDNTLLRGKHRTNKKNWVRYIAKTGHKWYPIESITEFLLNKLGEVFGLKMANSRIVVIGGQLRFLSEYFIKQETEELIHGAEIISAYLNVEPSYVEEVDKQHLTRELFPLQLIEQAVKAMFPKQADEILRALVLLIIYDAIVGNNDRHFYNWGVVDTHNNKKQPYFSPVYDTARGLFWNYSEDSIHKLLGNGSNVDAAIQKYCQKSQPKIGWEGLAKINHFELVNEIFNKEFYISKSEIKTLISYKVLEKMQEIIRTEFCSLFSGNRVLVINKCLSYRFTELNKML